VWSDEALIAGLGRRDPAASLVFYDRVRPLVDRTLARLLGARDRDYEDVAQAALYEIVVAIGRFRGDGPLDAWLSVIIARAAYRQIRQRRLERRFFSTSMPSDSTAGPHSAPVPFASREAVDRVRTYLARMDVQRAWTFLLHDVYGYSLEQIGQIMGSSVSAAQSRLVRGRREIHERIRHDPGLARFLDDLSEDVP
jgi:RNA polymerase sigma-70 factor, ECF subfamily